MVFISTLPFWPVRRRYLSRFLYTNSSSTNGMTVYSTLQRKPHALPMYSLMYPMTSWIRPLVAPDRKITTEETMEASSPKIFIRTHMNVGNMIAMKKPVKGITHRPFTPHRKPTR